ncbi:MAG: CII family transcriptional regulator [Spongiibacteraceae bacterium]
MIPSSTTSMERARKNLATTLRALASVGQAPVAKAMGISEGQISKLKSERLEEFCELLAHCGLKVVPQDHKCYPQKYVDSLHYLAERGMQLPPPDEIEDEMGLY